LHVFAKPPRARLADAPHPGLPGLDEDVGDSQPVGPDDAVYELGEAVGATPRRRQAGVIGYALNRRADQPSTVVIYLQTTTLEQIKTFCTSADLKATMQRAGVVGAPKITFVQGQDWASY
jgi:hypothetical protein